MEKSVPDVEKLRQKIVMDQNQQVCLICHDDLIEVGQLIRLLPCKHKLCETCFTKYFQEVEKNKCPTCITTVLEYQVINSQTGSETSPIEFKEMKKENSLEK